MVRLFTDAKGGNNSPIAIDVFAGQVIQQSPTLTYEFQQPLPRTVIVLVHFEVFGEVVDTKGKQSDLGFGRPGVVGGFLEALSSENFLLFLGR